MVNLHKLTSVINLNLLFDFGNLIHVQLMIILTIANIGIGCIIRDLDKAILAAHLKQIVGHYEVLIAQLLVLRERLSFTSRMGFGSSKIKPYICPKKLKVSNLRLKEKFSI